MSGIDYQDYYVRHSVDELWQHALRAHRALWPGVESVVRMRSTWAAPAVIEGWAILPAAIGCAMAAWHQWQVQPPST
jgi:hypothetical protein